MKFGTRPVSQCEGSILAHSLKLESKRFKKGHVLTVADIKLIAASKVESLIVATLEEGDVGEDEAARRLADSIFARGGMKGISLSPAGTGRVNFHADTNGVFCVSRELVDAINRIDPGVTLASLENLEPVLTGRMVATVKIIPYAISQTALNEACRLAEGASVLSVEAYRSHRIGIVSTLLPSLKDAVIDKTIRVLEARLAPSASAVVDHRKVPHTAEAVAEAIKAIVPSCDMIILFGASAICDEKDVIPSALRLAGGKVERVGMPVDPGNLLMLGSLSDVRVIGAPGCARSPARNGLDFVLERLLGGIDITAQDLAGMGVGGLLMEIGSRPQPREIMEANEPNVSVVLLAAGQSRRMGDANKLTLQVNGKAMVRQAAEASMSVLEELFVVTGHEAPLVEKALDGLDAEFVHNPEYETGLSSSLKAGVKALGSECTHAMIMLGDMPFVDAAAIEKMVETLRVSPDGSILVATSNGKRGNPVIWPRAYFDALTAISGDTGARHLIGENREEVVEVEIGEAATLDIDTPQAYDAL